MLPASAHAERCRRPHQAIEAVTSVLGVSDEEASILLRFFKWNAVRVHEEWFQARSRLPLSIRAASNFRSENAAAAPRRTRATRPPGRAGAWHQTAAGLAL